MSGSIRLDPEHGVNPTMGVCLFCKKPDGTIGMVGFNKGKAAPQYSIISPEPCNSCKDGMAKGITFVEAIDHDNNGRAFKVGHNVWLTGRMVVVTEEYCRRVINNAELLSGVLKHRKAYIDTQMMDMYAGDPETKRVEAEQEKRDA